MASRQNGTHPPHSLCFFKRGASNEHVVAGLRVAVTRILDDVRNAIFGSLPPRATRSPWDIDD